MIKVMLVDDEALMRKGLQTLIDWPALDCTVIASVENGRRAIEAYEKQPADIIISDIKMPVMDGIALAEYLYTNQKPAKVILLTAFADFALAQQAIRYGVSEYVTKTGSMDGIVDAVEKCKLQLAESHQNAADEQEKKTALLQAIISGTLFREGDIFARAQQCRLQLNLFHLLVVDLAQDLPLADSEIAQLEQYVRRLVKHGLAGNCCYFMPLQKTTFCVIWGVAEGGDLAAACSEIAGMFVSTAQRSILIGACANSRTVQQIPDALRCADEALAESFYDRQPVHVYHTPTAQSGTVKYNSADAFDALNEALRRGDAALCEKGLTDLFARQLAARLPHDDAVAEGMALLLSCKRALARVGAELDDLGKSEREWKDSLRGARFFENCCALQKALIADTCRIVAQMLRSGTGVVTAAQNYIDVHFCEAITLGIIAEACNVHPSYLSRCFKQRTGDSIVDRITQKRMERAKKLIEDGGLKIYEVAQAVGIEDTTYFSHVFRKYTGLSPKSFSDATRRKEVPEDAR